VGISTVRQIDTSIYRYDPAKGYSDHGRLIVEVTSDGMSDFVEFGGVSGLFRTGDLNSHRQRSQIEPHQKKLDAEDLQHLRFVVTCNDITNGHRVRKGLEKRLRWDAFRMLKGKLVINCRGAFVPRDMPDIAKFRLAHLFKSLPEESESEDEPVGPVEEVN